jgi:hypothetical protein
MASFLQIASEACARGLKVIPLSPGQKKPFLPDWTKLSSNDPAQIKQWSELYPTANVGAVCSYENGNWILDVDDFNWFFEAWPFEKLPQTFTVRTGSGGLQFHFRHGDSSRTLRNCSLKNPSYVEGSPDKSIKASFLDVLIQDRQGVLPGSLHPNGNLYKSLNDLPLAEIDPKHLEWLKGLWVAGKSVAWKAMLNPLKPGVDIEEKLRLAGLKFTTVKMGDKVFFNYHALMGKCLIRGASHAQAGERPNDRQSAFVYDTKTNEIYHYCFSAGCSEVPGKTKVALEAIGLKLADLVVERRNNPSTEVRGLIVKRGSDVTPAHLRFLWEPYLAHGKLVHFGGHSGQGKSPVTIDLIARVTSGLSWPDGQPNIIGPRNVVLLNVEDALEDTIIPRLTLCGADLSRFYYVEGTECNKGDKHEEMMFTFQQDWLLLEVLIRELNPALVIIDPITNYLGRVDMNKEGEVRGLLTPIAKLARELDFVPITVGHFNRREKGTNPLQRMMGAAAFAGIARGVYVFGPDPDSESEHAHVMATARGAVGMGDALKYHTELKDFVYQEQTSKIVVVGWDGVSYSSAEDTVDPQSKGDKSDFLAAADVLKSLLNTGRQSAAECGRYLKAAGYEIQTGEDSKGINAGRLRKKIGAKTKKDGKVHFWFLPDHDHNTTPEQPNLQPVVETKEEEAPF